ncbi:MarR family winged helix-turn-helix transcriptional regulator [Streptomyces lasiicapitis]|uniref:MarR family transcriptional regulator n=1 Tax=Streptomyces lasiicapitis TaxID=1923961 RepID=A0ABQ2MV55_9ACTN|nr:MarR family winged helix-turn-helix transcriptional regulator [Streptomyces lasiicapitis]GGO58533.1 MarR family transcriptional regulator [Streptomyces lasiicapitis]
MSDEKQQGKPGRAAAGARGGSGCREGDKGLFGQARELTPALYTLSRVLRFQGMDEAGLWRLPPSELELMRYVHAEPGVTVGVLARELGMQVSNVSATVRGLVNGGLLEREKDPDDGRVSRLRPTLKAEQGMALIENAWAEIFADALAELSEAQREALLASVPALEALGAALKERRKAP